MRPVTPMRPSQGLAIACLSLSVAACTTWTSLGSKAPAEAVPASPSEAEIVAGHLDVMNRLGAGTPAEQAEIVESARRAYLELPGPSRQLRYACVLATPAHGGSDPAGARTLLGELLAAPERLGAAERALAQIVYREVNARLSLESELRELRTAMEQADHERAAAANRRIQAQAAENARLKKELDEALAKLEAIAELERSLVNRPAPSGERP